MNQVPLYVLFKRIQRADGAIGALEITYATFYAFNGPYSIGCCPPFCFEAGAHDGDWEHFTVRCGSCLSIDKKLRCVCLHWSCGLTCRIWVPLTVWQGFKQYARCWTRTGRLQCQWRYSLRSSVSCLLRPHLWR